MSSTTPNIGSSEWFTQQANKLIDLGLNALLHKTTTGETSGGSTTDKTSMISGIEQKLPYILGGVAVIGIVVLLAKR